MSQDIYKQITLTFSQKEVHHLWESAMQSFLDQQPERFEYPEGDVFTDSPTAAIFWSDAGYIGVKILRDYFTANGHQAFLLWDTDHNPEPCWALWVSDCDVFKTVEQHNAQYKRSRNPNP